jgi:hypothetical protein
MEEELAVWVLVLDTVTRLKSWDYRKWYSWLDIQDRCLKSSDILTALEY